MITLENCSRWYGQVIGVNDVTATISPGITALLGANGAGKSTLMRLVTGQLRPTTGTVLVDGEAPFANPEVFRKLGYCPEIDQFYERQTGRQFVRFLARLSGYESGEANRRADESIERVGMADRADRAIAGFSKGMRQRIKLAQAMLHEPSAILLDEPLNGLDPIGRREFMHLLGKLAAEGKTIVISSHILYEVEQLTQQILLLHRGRLLATGDLITIRSVLEQHPLRIRIETPESRRLASWLAAMPNVLSIQFEPGDQSLLIECREQDAVYTLLMNLAIEEAIPILGLSSPDNNLESVFRYLVAGA